MSKPTLVSVPAHVEDLPTTLLHLDALWHYDCVVRSPRSHAAHLPRPLHDSSPSKFHSANLPHHSQALHRVFNTFDANGDGTVSIHEISLIFHKLGLDNSIESSLASLVTQSHGHVDEQEFLALYESACSTPSSSTMHADADVEEDLLDAFHVFDKDGNGFITPDELQSVLCSLGFPQGRQLEACVDMIARVDENGDGQVDFFEFKKLFHVENPFLMITSY